MKQNSFFPDLVVLCFPIDVLRMGPETAEVMINVVWRVQQAFPQTDWHGLLQTSLPWQLGGLDHIDVAARNRATMTTHLRTRCAAFSGTRRGRVGARRITAPCARSTPLLGPSRGCADHKCVQCARQRRCDGCQRLAS